MKSSTAARIVDANLNRLTEALRVVEDVVRLATDEQELLFRVRGLRSGIGRATRVLRRQVISSRRSETDPGRADRFDRAKRSSLADVLTANFKRAEEAARVLEEVLKLEEVRQAMRMKAVRFRLYDLEREAVQAVSGRRAGTKRRADHGED